ncbi:MAG: ATP-binding protein [Chloroflexota bacterium]|nr:ATP-binding protein [Chloroflexota bacterium]
MTTAVNETISRKALIAVANQYESVADALTEIIDNPFDYRHGRPLAVEVTVNKRQSAIDVLDVGGEGMNEQGLADWIGWGTGHEHRETDIGQYHVGGKLAAIYLADALEIVCRRSSEDAVWHFVDKNWGSREYLLSNKELTQLSYADLEPRLRDVPSKTGFTLVRLTSLKRHRFEEEILVAKLSNIYRNLLASGKCSIAVNGAPVRPLEIPQSSVLSPVEIHERLPGGVTIKGAIWVTDRDRFEGGRGVRLRAGIRTIFNGRLITEGEEFGHYLAGRGPLQRLVGEIEIQHLKPNTTKDGWDTSSPAWVAVTEYMHTHMQPVVAFLREMAEKQSVPRELRKRANAIRDEVERILRNLDQDQAAAQRGAPSDATAAEGRQPPSPREPVDATPRGGHPVEKRTPRTPAPDGAVGHLLRKLRRGLPGIDFDALGGQDRSQMRTDPFTLVVNTDYPLYKGIGNTDEYLVETYVLGLLESELTDGSASALVVELDRVISEWSRARAESLA